MKNSIFPIFFLMLWSLSINAQNLPSLLTEKNINATFSILAYDDENREWGIAVATNNIYVGNSTIYIRPGLGAFSVIAETEPKYAMKGFEKLKAGKTIEEAIEEVRAGDEQSNYRQVSGIDAHGNTYAFTGESLKYWKGNASEIQGANYVVTGNQLSAEVLTSMAEAFEKTEGTLAVRLLGSLVAGQDSGGQISGKQSAAIVVKGAENEWYNQIDLRVDNSKNPIEELKTLMDYHYGRIRLNQAMYAQGNGNKERATKKLKEAESMLDGWTGMYSKIAGVNISLGNEDAAVQWIKKGLAENPNWKVNLSAFYVLKDHPEIKRLIKSDAFSIEDWESALGMLSNLGRELEVIELAKKLIDKDIESSYLNFILGRSYFYEKEKSEAIKYLEKALAMDKDNIEARKLLNRIQSN